MIEEALKFVSGQAIAAAQPKKIDIANPRKVYLSTDHDVWEVDTPPPPRRHAVETLDDVISLANRFAEAGSKPVVWYNASAVTLVIDDDDHRVETATLTLKTSAVFNRVKKLSTSPREKHDQKQFIRLLRIDLYRTAPDHLLLDIVRKVKIKTAAEQEGQVGRTKESMGKIITGEVSGEREIPDSVDLDIPVFVNPGEGEKIACHCFVEVESLERDTFSITPAPDEIDRIVELAVRGIGDRLVENLNEGVPCYYGAN